MVSLLTAHALFVGYEDKADVLSDVSVELRAGEILALIGPNGSGKSSLLRALTGTLKPRAGKIFLGNDELGALSGRERARRLALLPQETGALADQSLESFVAGGRYAHQTLFGSDPKGAQTVAEAIERCGLDGKKGSLYSELSGGEAQRALLARALAQAAPTLLVDEPTSSLDARHQLAAFGLLRELADAGRGILAVTHDLNLASQFADRVILLHEGGIRAEGAPRQLFTAELLTSVYGKDMLFGEAFARAANENRPWLLSWRC